jgi:hypothetical protein
MSLLSFSTTVVLKKKDATITMKIYAAVNGLTATASLLLQAGAVRGLLKGHLKDPYSSSCNGIHQEACLSSKDDVTGDFCVWCVAGAVPSECVNPEQAAMLPQGVFDCSRPGKSANDGGANKSGEPKKEERTFVFSPSSTSTSSESEPTEYHLTVTHHQVDENDDVFCDASSKSLSGYMDIKGSEYDKDGEDKHLFFWMFEKRGASSGLSGEKKEDDKSNVHDETTPFMVRGERIRENCKEIYELRFLFLT